MWTLVAMKTIINECQLLQVGGREMYTSLLSSRKLLFMRGLLASLFRKSSAAVRAWSMGLTRSVEQSPTCNKSINFKFNVQITFDRACENHQTFSSNSAKMLSNSKLPNCLKISSSPSISETRPLRSACDNSVKSANSPP